MFDAPLTRLGVALEAQLLSDDGAAAVEFGVIVCLVAVIVICAVGAAGGILLGWSEGIHELGAP